MDAIGLSMVDIIVFLAFFVIVIGVSMYKSRGEETGEDFFLASRGLLWPLIGLSLMDKLKTKKSENNKNSKRN